jgi:Tachylectin
VGDVHLIAGGGNGVIFAVRADGALLYFKYTGSGQSDPAAATGFDPNSGNQIGNSWQGVSQLVGGDSGVIFAAKPNGDLLYYKYTGSGQSDPSGATGFDPNSGNQIGHGF